MAGIPLKLGKRTLALILICVFLLTACKAVNIVDNNGADNGKKDIQAAEPVPEITVLNTVLWPGEFFSIVVKPAEAQDEIRVTTDLEQPAPVFYSNQNGRMALIGISCRTKEGKYKYSIQVLRNNTVVARKDFVMDIMLKQFSEQRLKVSKKQQEQRSDDNLNDDRVHVDRAKSDPNPEPLWEGLFIKPVEGRISTEFGMIRYVNDQETGRHAALDISAKTGTPVAASNSGIVKLAMMLKVTGNTVIIDHGCGIFSTYCHLDKMAVKEGQLVKKGELVGEVGSTGFSTGPHLHWTISIGSTYVDPKYLMERDPLEFIKLNIK